MKIVNEAIRTMMVRGILSHLGIKDSAFVEKALVVENEGKDYKVSLAGYNVVFTVMDFDSERELLERYLMPASIVLCRQIIKVAVGDLFSYLDGL